MNIDCGESTILLEMIQRHPEMIPLQEEVQKGFEIIRDAFKEGGKLLVCGNGGSAADADHIVGELMKGFKKKRSLPQKSRECYGSLADGLQEALPAIALTQHTALVTAFGNDVDASMIYAQQVYGYGRPGDVLWALSTSGNSANVVNAAKVAGIRGLKVFGMTGKSGGALKELADVCITVPEEETAFVQEQHIILYHTLCGMLEEYFFGKDTD